MKQNKIEELLSIVLHLQQQSLFSDEKMKSLIEEIKALKEKAFPSSNCPEIRRIWLPREEVMKFLGYGETRISFIIKENNIATTAIGKRTFVSTKSLMAALEKRENTNQGNSNENEGRQ